MRLFNILLGLIYCVCVQSQAILKEGISIPIRTSEEIVSKQAYSPKFVVHEDIRSKEGAVVVLHGTPVEAAVYAEPAGAIGEEGTISIRFISTKAVDGQKISLESGSFKYNGKSRRGLAIGLAAGLGWWCWPCIACLAIKGKEAVIPQGTLFDGVYSAGDYKIE